MRVAITGGICDGKTTVLNALGDLGYPTISSDEVVSEVYSEAAFLEGLRKRFGEEAVREGSLNREWARSKAFSDARFRRSLNRLVHPEIARRLFGRIEKFGGRLTFSEVPLLIETSLQGHFDRVWVVDAGARERLRRLAARLGGDEAGARVRLGTQLPTAAKRAFADRIIRTESPPEAVKIVAAELAAELA